MVRKINIASDDDPDAQDTATGKTRKVNPKIEIEIPGPTEILENIEGSLDKITTNLEEVVTEIFKSRTKARIYLYLVTKGQQTSDQVSKGTGLYPSTVRDALADMHSHGFLNRTKVEKEGAGKHPYIYVAIAPSLLVEAYAKAMENRLTALLNVKRILKRDSIKLPILPVTIYIGGQQRKEKGDQDK
jgi:predicted transcriptional regulator